MDRPISKIYTVALSEEAAPLIGELELKPEPNFGSQAIYRNEDTALIISGIGKVKSAAATARLFSRDDLSENVIAINFGIAGGVDPLASAISDLFLIHKISDAGSHREFLPDMIAQTDLAETEITTFDFPVHRGSNNIPRRGLVDMEASGFYEAASLFAGPHRIACLKIVSDHLEGKKLDRKLIRSLVEQHAHTIAALAETLASLVTETTTTLSSEDEQWMTFLISNLRLTVSQTHLLRDRVIAHRLCSKHPLPHLTVELIKPPKTKAERNKRFEAIRKTLSP